MYINCVAAGLPFVQRDLQYLSEKTDLMGPGSGIAKCPFDPDDNPTLVYVSKSPRLLEFNQFYAVWVYMDKNLQGLTIFMVFWPRTRESWFWPVNLWQNLHEQSRKTFNLFKKLFEKTLGSWEIKSHWAEGQIKLFYHLWCHCIMFPKYILMSIFLIVLMLTVSL